MKQASTLLLKLIVTLFGLAVLALCIFVLPAGIRNDSTGMYRTLLIGMYLPAFPFFIGLFHTLKLLSYIDKNKVFSQASVDSLKYIKYCAFIVSGLYMIGLPLIFKIADQDDAPGVMLLGLMFTFGPLVIAVLSAVFQKLLQNAISIKLENDQTV